ncbi:HAMP domain-containing sensor histidine kinase [Clostridium aestuarii]|uniref:histidine kinase n=1 Tax=Clostridium aestuarii TaxID=338193 RepID=A0ABT4D297_9CLOT|nr:HAMP domain-containing sensor histidine kinase [Clostridium aestuarii]MCY6485232.1 HAMP domain-containing sensor histidine kinase [Clostridium aestuarii]
MSIKKRLGQSYIAMLIIPVILTLIVNYIMVFHYLGRRPMRYESSIKDVMAAKILMQYMNIAREVDIQLLDNAKRLENINYLQNLDEKLKEINANVVIQKGNDIIYCSEKLKNIEIQKYLPEFGATFTDQKHYISTPKRFVLLQQKDFYFKQNIKGSLFVIMDLSSNISIVKKYDTILHISMIIILALTNGILTFIVSKSIIRPIEKLKNAANDIKKGTFNEKIKYNSNDEIGELCMSFEEMRKKLMEVSQCHIQYEKNRKELISNISHDLKTPITAVKGYVEGIKDGIADTPDKMDKYINTIYNKAVYMDNLIDELFLFSKLDLKKVPFKFEIIDIKAYLEDIIDETKFELEKKNIQIHFYCVSTNLLEVRGDREKLKRVIVNILGNCIKYMNKEIPQINVKLTEENEDVMVQIEDNGQGISKEALTFIFDRFYRADPSRNTSIGGNGLGLAIAKQIIEEHGGQMWAQSEMNKGTSVFFKLKKYSKRGDGGEKNLNY